MSLVASAPGVLLLALTRPGSLSYLFCSSKLIRRKQEEAYAEQVRERLEKQLQRRAQELGYELKKIAPALATLPRPDGEVLS